MGGATDYGTAGFRGRLDADAMVMGENDVKERIDLPGGVYIAKGKGTEWFMTFPNKGWFKFQASTLMVHEFAAAMRADPAAPVTDEIDWPQPNVVETKTASVVKVSQSPSFVFDDEPTTPPGDVAHPAPQPDAVSCEYKRSNMTPCYLENGPDCLTDCGRCVGCDRKAYAIAPSTPPIYAAQRSAQDCADFGRIVLEECARFCEASDGLNMNQPVLAQDIGDVLRSINLDVLARVAAKRRAK